MQNGDDPGAGGAVGSTALTPIWANIRELIDRFVPEEERADFELAGWLYLETHPALREYVSALRDQTGAS